MTDTSNVVTPAAINRLSGQAASQTESATTALAMAPYEYGDQPITPTNPTVQDQHPAAQRLATKQWGGKTGTLNQAQAAAPDSDVWVTVPVDKIITAGGSSKVAPIYASAAGYRPRPGESTGSIPPPMAAGKGA